MRKAIFWGVLGTLAEPAPSAQGRCFLDPAQYRVYPDAAATLALCAYKGFRNYLLAGDFPQVSALLPDLCLEPFFRDRVVSGRVELAGSQGDGIFRRAELAAHFPQCLWLVSGDPEEIAKAKEAGWHTVQVHGSGAGADIACLTLSDVWRVL